MSDTSNAERASKLREIAELRARIDQLEAQVSAGAPADAGWEQRGLYTAYYATTGFMLGMLAAATSLLFNVVGSVIVGQHPLYIIKVYLTFPLGAKALSPEFDTGIVLAIGCCLYVATGMVLGILFQLVMARFAHDSLQKRFVVGTAWAVAIWLVNFYGILSWLQPLLFHGDWIIELTPWWVGLATHLVFGWTMALVFPLGVYSPYRRQTELS